MMINNRTHVGICSTLILVLCCLALSLSTMAAEPADDQPLLALDEAVWATFYDLPSRRFRTIRDAFIRKDFDAVSRELSVTIGFLLVEARRSVDELQAPLTQTIGLLEIIRDDVRDTNVSVGDLDAAFARTHWLLAQHYLLLAMQSRDAANHKNAGRYLWATAHHLERAVLWSDARINRALVKALDAIRNMGSELQSSKKPERVYRNRPFVATAKTLVKIGEHLDRKVWVADSLPPGS